MTLQTRQLPVGDALWIARHKQLKYEYVLDFIVERKRVDDLWHSIKDNRYKQQKLRLMVSYSLDHFSAFFFYESIFDFSTGLSFCVWVAFSSASSFLGTMLL